MRNGRPGEALLGPRASRPPLSAPEPLGGHTGWRSRGYLPHFDSAETIQTVTFRLADSLPKAVCDELARLSDVDKRRSRLDAVLDQGRGSCALRAAPAAVIVQNALGFFDGERYKLLAWVVMPNHVHVMIEQIEGYRLNEIIGSWKSFTSKAINALNRSSGVFWAPDYFDRFIRDERHYANAVEYIEQNPVKAGLATRAEDWPYSSVLSRLSAR